MFYKVGNCNSSDQVDPHAKDQTKQTRFRQRLGPNKTTNKQNTERSIIGMDTCKLSLNRCGKTKVGRWSTSDNHRGEK